MVDLKKMSVALVIVTLLLQAMLIASAYAMSPHKIERRLFVHYANSANAKVPQGGIGYYALMGVQWDTATLPVKVEVNTAGSGLVAMSVISAINTAAEEWDDGAYSGWGGVVPNLFEVSTVSVTTTFDWIDPLMDGKNTILWGNYPQAGVIAVTITWYDTSTNNILEFDMVFDTDFKWSTTGTRKTMDVQNIATHELGHAVGLADLYIPLARKETMYGYSTTGETTKRSLYTGDKTGRGFR